MTEFWFDEAAARAAENFFDRVLTHVKGEWAGQPFTLKPWQREEVIRPLFGWKRRDGAHPDRWIRRYRVAYIEIPRKNGKSSLAAGIALYLLFADGEPGAEVYSAADREQAGIVFELAREMVEARPILARRAETFKRSIVCPENHGSYKVLSADAFTKHGLNASGVVVDELHAQPTRELVDVLVTPTESRLPQRPAGSHCYQAVHRLGGPVGCDHGAKRDVKIDWPHSTWANVRQAISSSSIVVYRGHGLSLGDLPADPTELYGRLNGFCLAHPEDLAG